MDHYFTADDIQLMNETFDLLTEAQGTTVELMQTAMAGDSAAAVAKANSVMTEWSDTIAVNMDTLISRNDELVKQNIQEQKDLYNQNMILSLILLAISFVAFVMVVVVIIKTVVKPLRKQTSELTEIIDEIKGGHGDLTKRVTVKSMDEIGQSSIGINHFIETLQNIMSNIISNSNVLDGVVGNVASSVAASSDNANDIFRDHGRAFCNDGGGIRNDEQRQREYDRRGRQSTEDGRSDQGYVTICAGYEEACDGA